MQLVQHWQSFGCFVTRSMRCSCATVAMPLPQSRLHVSYMLAACCWLRCSCAVTRSMSLYPERHVGAVDSRSTADLFAVASWFTWLNSQFVCGLNGTCQAAPCSNVRGTLCAHTVKWTMLLRCMTRRHTEWIMIGNAFPIMVSAVCSTRAAPQRLSFHGGFVPR
jgi:hypothetical protein